MKAVDTNILVRFLVNDDPVQANKVIQLFTNAEQNDEALFVSLLVILEVVWVLQSAYSVSRADIVSAISSLLQMSIFEFENQNTLRDFMGLGSNYSPQESYRRDIIES